MPEREDYFRNNPEELEEEALDEEEVDLFENIEHGLDEIKRTEENEELLEEIYTTLDKLKGSYDDISDVDTVNEVLKEIHAAVVQPLEHEDIEAAEANWYDIKLELNRLNK